VGRMLSIAENLARARQIPRGDVAQLRARAAEARAQVSSARRTLIEARLALAASMGFLVARVEDTPSVSGPWPALPDSAEFQRLSDLALTRLALRHRADLAATRQLSASAAVLADAARNDLKRRLDLALTVSYQGLHEGGNLAVARSLFTGYGESLTNLAPGPSVKLALSFDLPFANREARGRYAQSRALGRQSYIRARDLERTIEARIEELTSSLRASVVQVRFRESAVQDYQELVDSQLTKFRAGQSTVVDVILTQQQLISAQIALVTARQTLATLLAQLRFEIGALVEYRIEDDDVLVDEIVPLGYSFATAGGN